MPRLVLAIVCAVLAASSLAPDRAAATHSGFVGEWEAPWRSHVDALDAALAKQDLRLAERELEQGYRAALGSRRWEGMLEVGDAFLRVAAATELRQRGMEKARQAYLYALLRARSKRSLDGVLRVAEAFGNLRDRSVVAACLRIADGLARNETDRARIRSAAWRLTPDTVVADVGF